MAIRTIVTRGYGNGTFQGDIALVTTRGYKLFVFVRDFIPVKQLADIIVKNVGTEVTI